MSRLALSGILALLFCGCATRRAATGPTEPLRPPDQVLHVRTTGYCDCGVCCNWEETHWGKTIVARGPNRGMPTQTGVTAQGTPTGPGTIAADPSVFPFGTIVSVPGYGVGTVADTSGALHGTHLDLWFKTHEQVEGWGEQTQSVKIWMAP